VTADPGYVVCAPMRVEQLAVAAGLRGTGVTVERTGMGPAHSGRWARNIRGGGPVILLGVAGGVAADVEPGDVVVATAVSTKGGVDPVSCAATDEVADAIRSLGLRVRAGPIASCATLAAGTKLVRLGQSGPLAVDMESAYVAAGIGPRSLVVVRVITDTADQPIFRPSIIARGARALGALRRVARTVPDWADSIEACAGP
jgi:4-hydroxy-3-methylbut-2-en-1-yl diphosphate reductase